MSEVSFDIIETTGRVCRNSGFGWNYLPFPSLESTSKQAKEHYHEFTGPTLLVAKHQTAGYGRNGTVWDDNGADPGTEGSGAKNFLSTWSMKLKTMAPDPRWTLGVGLYLYESLSEAFSSVRFAMKAPNDICIGDKKIAGIMVEASSEGGVHQLHVGLGINIFSYPTQYSATATHLNAVLGTDQLNAETWSSFVEYFGKSLLHLEKKIASGTITGGKGTEAWLGQISNRLLGALNRHPMYAGNPVRSIQPNGSLALERGEINWTEL